MLTKYEDFKGPDDFLYKVAQLVIAIKSLIKEYQPKTADH